MAKRKASEPRDQGDDGFVALVPDDDPFEPIEPDPDAVPVADTAGPEGYGPTPDMTTGPADG